MNLNRNRDLIVGLGISIALTGIVGAAAD